MAKKRKDQKSASTIMDKEDHNHSGAGKLSTTVSSSQQNAPPLNHQLHPVGQWPYTAQSDADQSPFIQWQQSQHHQPNGPNLAIHQVQQSQPIWMAQRPFYHFSPLGTTDITWQSPAITSGGISVRSQAQAPSFSHSLFGYPYPGFPGPWDLSSWWGQTQPHCIYTFPGACGGYFPSLPPPMLKRGIIQPPPKLSQKHHQLWEAQSAENVQLWNVVGQLQSELSDHKKRLAKLELDILSLNKPTMEVPANRCTGPSSSTGQTSKRGRRKSPTLANVQTECIELNFHQGIQKMEDKPSTVESLANDRETEINFTSCNDGIKICEASLKNLSGSKTADKNANVETKSHSATMWPANMFMKDFGRESFYNDANAVSGHGRKVVGGWGFGNEKDTSIGLDNADLELGKDEDEEREDGGSSGSEDIA